MREPFPFTGSAIDRLALEPGETDVWCWDTEQPGLGVRLRLGKKGVSKRWYAAYRFAGNERRDPLGNNYGLADARHRVYEMRRDADDGIDPREQKAAKIADAVETASCPIFADYVLHYLETKEREHISAARYREIERYLTGPHVEPFHQLRLNQITKAKVAARLDFLVKTGITKPSAHVAQAARMALSNLFNNAVADGHVKENPVEGTREPLPPRNQKARDRTLANGELVAIWNAASGADELSKVTRLLILLGCRRSEIGGMRWSEIDDFGNWTLPAERSKNGKANTLPLPPAALDIVRSMPRHEGRDQIFGKSSPNGFTSWLPGKRKLDARLDLAPWMFHDLRRTLVTGMHDDLDIAPHIVEAIVNHTGEDELISAGRKRSSVHKKHYNHAKYLRQKGDALRQWSEHVLGLGVALAA